MREGDWICSSCNGLNFKFRRMCYSCKNLRPRREGEWNCGHCNHLNDAKNTSCLRCGEEQEEEVEEEADADADATADHEGDGDAAAEGHEERTEPEAEASEGEAQVEGDDAEMEDPAPSPRRSPSPRLASPVRPAETTEPAAKAAKTLPAKPKAKAKARAQDEEPVAPVSDPPARPARPPPPTPATGGRDMKPDEAIKVLARLAPNFKKSWVQYCRMLRDTSDPSKLDTDFIQQFLDYVADLIEADLPSQDPPLYGAAKAQQVQVAIRRSLADKIAQLNKSGKLQNELRLEAVAKHLAKLEEERALQVLTLLEKHSKQVQDPNEFVRIQATLEGRRQHAELDVVRPVSQARRLPRAAAAPAPSVAPGPPAPGPDATAA